MSGDECPDCNGHGAVQIKYATDTVECATCQGGRTIVPPRRISTLQVIHSLFAFGFRKVEAEQTQLRFVKVKADGDEMEFELESPDETLRGRAWVPLHEVMGGWKWGWKEIKLPLVNV